MMEIGSCDYENELESLTNQPRLSSDSSITSILAEKSVQLKLQNSTQSKNQNTIWEEEQSDFDELMDTKEIVD